ncbi:MAG: hypothetical protein HXK05_04125 [Actinomyces graevenitzii]|uniref:Uncharacterized protein n=1 Tax=Actinomyces graevenitzii TaxID=55565 RepID=A0A9E7D6S7_9ACTO|nr:hypothetical protein [Actinomyces graevenitzii]UQF79803.1 MAG: hypothetical protein M3I41_00545 [Actinomyces graevenitzii]
MSTNRPNASIWDDDEGEAQLRPMMRKNNAHLFDDEPPVSSLSAASAASAAAAVAGYTASSAAEANAASALSAPSAYSVGSASSALSARSAGSAHSAVSASSAAVPSAASAAAPEAAGAAVSAPTPDSAGSAPLSTRSGATPDAAPSAASAQSGAPSAASAPAMPPSQAPKSAPSAPVNGPVLGTTPSVHVPASSLANNGVPAMLANTPPATGRRYTNAENAHTSGTFDSAARRATATTAATSATASTGASALTAASAAAASVTAQSPASATSANAPELADAAKPAVADAGAANPGAVRRRSLFTAVPQPVPVDEDSDDETIQVPVVREDLIPDSFSAASAVSASAASASATSAAESASAAETASATETTSAAETSSSVSAASAPSSLEHSSTATSPASASDDVAPAPAATPAPAVTVPTPESAVQADQADQEAVDSVQELNDAHEVEAAAVPLPTDFDAPSAISIPTPPHTVSSALSAESTFSIDSAVSAASAASSVGITLPSAATPAPTVPVTSAPTVPVTPAAGATDTASNELSKTTPAADAPEPPAPPAPEQPEATSVEADFADDEVVASDHTETTIMDAADMELEEVVKPVVTSTSPVGVERLDHLATADSADLAPVAPSPSSAIFASTRTAAFSDSANQSDADNEVDDDVLLAGSTVVGKPASRAAAHWGGTLLALVLFPIAWFLMHTAANALTGALADGWPKVFSTAGIIELGMAIVLLIVVMATATRSSLGTFVTGITTLLIGLPFVVVPSITKQYLGDFLANMALQSRFGRILSEAILLDGVSGRLVIIGLFLIMLGVVSHSTRRAGRRERLVMDRANTKK